MDTLRGSEPLVLGLAASHNGAAALVRGGEVLLAVQEERLTRRKRAVLEPGGANLAVPWVLEHAGVSERDLDLVVVCAIGEPELPSLSGRPALAIPHHLGHAWSAWVASGLQTCGVWVIDGAGSPRASLTPSEQAVARGSGREVLSLYRASEDELVPVAKHLASVPLVDPKGDYRWRMPAFASLGGMYQSVAQQLFGSWQDAGKVMGLSPYGRPTLPPEAFFEIAADGRLAFRDEVPLKFRMPDRWPAYEAEYRDLAASTQAALEAGIDHVLGLHQALGLPPRLAYAGGVALNGLANERLVRSGAFEEVFLMPAAEDCGTALGAAWWGVARLTGRRPRGPLGTDALGRRYTRAEIAEALGGAGEVSAPDELEREVARELAGGAVVAWFQGRSEFGPRALGQRSILLDPRRADGKDHLNAKVKHREAFRPFAPAILAERAEEWLQLEGESPFMLRIVPFRPDKRALVPAVVHVDGTGRVQTVSPGTGRFRSLLEAFDAETGVPILLNTSFNVRGEPIVETPEDAVACARATGIDLLAIGDFLLRPRRG